MVRKLNGIREPVLVWLWVSTHYAFFGHSLVFSCFIICLLFKDFFFLFLIKLYNLQKRDNTKTLNYGQKVHSVYSPYDHPIYDPIFEWYTCLNRFINVNDIG